VVAALALAALVAYGCGGDDDSAGGGGGDGGGAATTGGASGPTVRIGYVFPDLSAFEVLNPAFSIGDPEVQAQAVLDAWRREGILPIAGRDIELVFRNYNIISDDDKLAACTGFAQDDEVFAVVAGRDFTVGSECLTERFQIPVIDTNSAPASLYQRGAPYFFTLRTDQSTYFRNFARWADENGFLEGKTIGLFYETRLDEAIQVFREELAALGHEIAVEVSSTGEGVGSPQDQISAQQFQAEGVDLAILAVGGSSSINFLSFADRQGYTPDYIDLDYGEHTTDVAAGPNPESQYDGVPAMTITRIGGIAAGDELNDAQQRCVDAFERFSGEDLVLEAPETGELSNVFLTCDLFEVLRLGLEGAGEDQTAEAFVTALEAIEDLELASSGNLGFAPDDHSGVDAYRTIVWDAACPCWQAEGDFEPME
jgi:hypothetical protein